MNKLKRILGVARFSGQMAFRSRRAIVTALTFAFVGAGLMYMMVSLITFVLSHIDNTQLVQDLIKENPIVFVFAKMAFLTVPLLTLFVTAPTAAAEIRSGSVRYLLLRVTRTEWALGLFLAEAAVLLAAMALMALAAGGVVAIRLPGWSGVTLLPQLLAWAVRAWFYALAWLGVFLGASLISSTPGKATMTALLAMVIFMFMGIAVTDLAPWLDYLRPEGCRDLMWSMSVRTLLGGAAGLLGVALLWLGVGTAIFKGRDL